MQIAWQSISKHAGDFITTSKDDKILMHCYYVSCSYNNSWTVTNTVIMTNVSSSAAVLELRGMFTVMHATH